MIEQLIEMLYKHHSMLTERISKTMRQFEALREASMEVYMILHDLWLYMTPGPYPGRDIPTIIERATLKMKELDEKFKLMKVD